MKTKKIHIALFFLIIVAFTSCNDWLDVSPTDKMLEKQQYASEENINSATNGLYRQLTSENLYGGQLTQTTLELMAHYYTYSPNSITDPTYINFYELGHYNYTSGNTAPMFAAIWKEAYQTILHINSFMKGVKESTAVMPQAHKNILLGEAYGMRAYIHFDLFRIYGPIYRDRTDAKVLPYNEKTEITLNHTGYEETEYSTAEEYMKLVLEDLATAGALLESNDPIVTEPSSSITDVLSGTDFYRNRNRRMNYYAVKALEARVRQYIGEEEEAAEAAKVVTDQMGNVFNWAVANSVDADYNYIFFNEVIFGINNLDMSSRAKKYYLGSNMGSSYVVDHNHLLKNIFGDYDNASLGSILDSRARQWSASNVKASPFGYSTEGSYISNKYTTISTKKPAIADLQVLMRVSEMYYIQAEVALKAGAPEIAINILNDILLKRGLTVDDLLKKTSTNTEILSYIEREYYREFFGEGQVFFFHKRHKSTKIFNGYGEGTTNITIPAATYVIPIPDEEKNI
jgi:hypothetical protein